MVFSICSRTYIPALAGDHGYLLFAMWSHIGLLSRYLYSCHLFESISLDNIHEIFAILKDKDIIIEDPLNLNGIFTQYQNLSELEKYFDNNMSK